MELYNLKKSTGINKKSKRVGRGIGSGKGGHTTGKGQKGQKARVGNSLPAGFEGGQSPLHKRIPMMGRFQKPVILNIGEVSLTTLNTLREGSNVTPETFVEKGLFKKLPNGGIKVLGSGKLTKKLNLKGFKYSESAKTAIVSNGGQAD